MSERENMIQQWQRKYESLPTGDEGFLDWKSFSEELRKAADPEILEFHYELLRDRSIRLRYLILREAFSKRSEASAGAFLLARLKEEKDPGLRADILVMLDLMRRPESLELARDGLRDQDGEMRYAACGALGAVGKAADIARLRGPLLDDSLAPVRIAAANAHSQLHDRLPGQKTALLRNLRDALEAESDDEVTRWVVLAAADILRKRFGLRYDEDEGEVIGDLPEARERCTRALAKLDL